MSNYYSLGIEKVSLISDNHQNIKRIGHFEFKNPFSPLLFSFYFSAFVVHNNFHII